jgi:phosphatidylethanolamine/phosphatidyl-N-methylethanolamine N-methyltransferase
MNAEQQLFFSHWLRKPVAIASALPSSFSVAVEIAREARLDCPGAVLELGAGTGSITRGLLAAGCPPERLVLIEREPELVRYLHATFPRVRVIEGDVGELGQLLDEHRIESLASVVSTLPIRWFDLALKRRIVETIFARLVPEGVFVQATNAFSSPLPCNALGLHGDETARIWWHFLPIQVWRYRTTLPTV